MKWKRWGYIALGVIALAEILVPRLVHVDHAHFGFEDLPAFGSGYGLLSCILIIKVSKLLGKLWLMRPEDYYEGAESFVRALPSGIPENPPRDRREAPDTPSRGGGAPRH
jgi:hypothetical protein